MSIRDLDKKIILSNATNGQIEFSIDYEDYLNSSSAEQYLYYQVSKLLNNEQGCLLKIGYKSE